jgi:tetratricopeptide (TPR) repeat protein
MARSLLSSTLALSVAMLLLLSRGAAPASAQQPTPPVAPQPTPPAAPQQGQYPEVQEAIQLLREGKMPEAVKVLEDASRKYPALPAAHVLMYEILLRMNQPNLARLQLDEAIKANRGDPEPYVILGAMALQDRRLSEAGIDFEKAQQLLAAYANAQRKEVLEHQTKSGLAQVAEARGDWKEAESQLRDMLKLTPEDLLAYQRLARALFWQGKDKEAYDVLRTAKQIDREIAKKRGAPEVVLTPEAILAQYYDQREGPASKTGIAEKFFKAALRMTPDDLPTRRAVAVWALERGDLSLAKEQAEAALKIESDPRYGGRYRGSNLGHELRGLVALWEKDWATAEKNFEDVYRADPADVINRNNLALALVKQSDDPAPIDLAKRKRAYDLAYANYNDRAKVPEALKPELLSTLAWVHFRRNEPAEADTAIKETIKAVGGLENAKPDTLTYLALMLHRGEQDWNAKIILENILKSPRAFSMRSEALKLYDKVKDAKNPAEAAPAAKSP